MQIDTLLIRNIAHAKYECGQNTKKKHMVRVNKDHTLVRVLLLNPNCEFYIQRFSLQVLFNMDTQSNSRRARKSAQEREDWRWQRNKRERARCAAETAEQRSKRLRKRRERDRARHSTQTASERQATSQWKSTRERERIATETPEERELNKITADEHQPVRKVGS